MSVISGSKTVFCEGKINSLDYRILYRIVENLSEKVTIVPSGSKFTFSIFAGGYFSANRQNNQKYLVFRDRDFDIRPTTEIKLLQFSNIKQDFLSHRACIENYLLNAELIHHYWSDKYKEKQENPASKWGYKDSPGISILNNWIKQAALSIKDYQAIRWALADLQFGESRVQIKTTWTGGSGKLPKSFLYSDCKQEALNLIATFQTSVKNVNQDRFEESLSYYQQLFSQDNFWEEQQYLIWFHGKDLQKAMQKQKSQYISLSHFFNWATDYVELNEHSDLMELQVKIREL